MANELHMLLQVTYGQVRPVDHEALVDFGGAAMHQAWQVYAYPEDLVGPTPVRPFS